MRGKLVLDPAAPLSAPGTARTSQLTVTEFLILQALAQRPGYVKSRDNLMDAAYDDQVYVDDRTIDSHIKRLRKKFKAVDDEFDAIETLYGVGYRYRRRLRRREKCDPPRAAPIAAPPVPPDRGRRLHPVHRSAGSPRRRDVAASPSSWPADCSCLGHAAYRVSDRHRHRGGRIALSRDPGRRSFGAESLRSG